jgi:hypothetical protein
MTHKKLYSLTEISNTEFHDIRNMLDKGLDEVKSVIQDLLRLKPPGNYETRQLILEIVKGDLSDKIKRDYSKEDKEIVRTFSENIKKKSSESNRSGDPNKEMIAQNFLDRFTAKGSKCENEQIIRLAEGLPDILNNEDKFIGFLGRQVLKEMSIVIGNTISKHYEHACRQNASIYIWPGYERVPGVNPAKPDLQERFVLKDRYPDESVKGKDLYCGMGVNWNNSKSEDDEEESLRYYYNSPASIFFDRLLMKPEEKYKSICYGKDIGGTGVIEGFLPGGTHKWLSHNDVYILKADADDKKRKLDILCISCDDVTDEDEDFMTNAWRVDKLENGREYVIDMNHNFLKIQLREDRRDKWGDDVGSVLNDKSGEILSSEYAWPFSDNPREVKNDGIQKIRRELYSIWLSASFCSDELSDDWIKENFTRNYTGEGGLMLAAVIQEAMHLLRRNSGKFESHKQFKYWYTLRLNKTLGFGASYTEDRSVGPQSLDVLGSIMIFSDQEIHPFVLLEIKEWVDYVYLSIRDLENNLVSITTGKNLGKKEDYLSKSHEGKDFLDLIRGDMPEMVYQTIRRYYATLYAVDRNVISQFYYENLFGVESLKEILKLSIKDALQLHFTRILRNNKEDFFGENSRYSENKSEIPNAIRERVEGDVNKYFDRYFSKGLETVENIRIIPERDVEIRMYNFYCLLLALHKNIIKHMEKMRLEYCEEEGAVEYNLQKCRTRLSVINESQGICKMKEEPGGTKQVLIDYAKEIKDGFNDKDVTYKKLGEVKSEIYTNVDFYKFQTIIPILIKDRV